MKTILLATDGSPYAARAADQAIELALAAGWPLHVVTVWEISTWELGLAKVPVPELGGAEREHAEDALAAAVEKAEAAGLTPKGTLRHGDPVEQICAAADEVGAGLVVIGSHGWNALKRLVLGSVSTSVLHNASCPVLVVRGETAEAAVEKPSAREGVTP